MLAVTLSIIVNLISIIPTWISTWEDPRRESRLAWLTGFIALLIALHSFKTWDYVAIGQTLVFLFLNGSEVLLLYFRPAPAQGAFFYSDFLLYSRIYDPQNSGERCHPVLQRSGLSALAP